MPDEKIVPYTITPKDNGTFDVFQNHLLVGNFPTRKAAEDAQKLAEQRHK